MFSLGKGAYILYMLCNLFYSDVPLPVLALDPQDSRLLLYAELSVHLWCHEPTCVSSLFVM